VKKKAMASTFHSFTRHISKHTIEEKKKGEKNALIRQLISCRCTKIIEEKRQ